MISRREFERERTESFALNLFWALESWTDSIKRREDDDDLPEDRPKLERALRHGFFMRVSQLLWIVDKNYRRLYAHSVTYEQAELEEVHLNDRIGQAIDYTRPFFDIMGSSIAVSDSPRVAVKAEKATSDWLFTFVTWWILDAWPDGQITVDFIADEEKVRVIFQDPNRVYHSGDHQTRSHGNLDLWACLIEHLAVVEYHGWCVFPSGKGAAGRLEIILPLRPPTAEELDSPLPTWIQ